MQIGSLTAMSQNIFRAQAKAAAELKTATNQMANMKNVLSAADNPSAVGELERIRSMKSENEVMIRLSNPAVVGLNSLSSQISSTRNFINSSASDRSSLVQALDYLKTLSNAKVISSEVFKGDPANPIIVPVNHAATSAHVSATLQPTIILAADSVVDVNGTDVDMATLDIEVDGASHSVQIEAKSYSASELASALDNAMVTNSIQVSVSLSGNELSLATISTGAASSLVVSGPIANAINMASSATGEDSYVEQVNAGPGPAKINFAGREVTFLNLEKVVSQVQEFLDSDNLTQAESLLDSTSSQLQTLESTIGFISNRIVADRSQLGLSNEILESREAAVDGFDLGKASAEAAKAQIQLEQATFAQSLMLKSFKDLFSSLTSKE